MQTAETETPSMLATMDFDSLAPRSVEFKYNGRRYLLKEATEAVSVAYRNASLKAAKMEDGKVRGMDGLADAEPILVAGCVFELYEAGQVTKERPVLLAQIQSWPARVVKPLYKRARELSDLDDPDTVESLQKQITSLEERRKALLLQKAAGGEGPDDSPKGGPTPTPTTSG